MKTPCYILPAVSMAFALLSSALAESPSPLNDLVERSPFMGPSPTPVTAAPATPTTTAAPSPLRYAGTLRTGDRTRFAIFNETTGKAFWVEEGQTVNDVTVVGWDRSAASLQVRQGQQAPLWLEFKRPELPITTTATATPSRENREMTREERREAWRAAAAERMREARDRGEPPARRQVQVPSREESDN